MNRLYIALGLVAVLVLLGALFWSHRAGDRVGKAVSHAALQAMERGYQCHADGRTLEDCQQEQIDRWKQVEAGKTDLPQFGIWTEGVGGYGTGKRCIIVKGAKGINGGGDGGDAVICGDGSAIGGAGGDGSK